jgi:hypothetical protein
MQYRLLIYNNEHARENLTPEERIKSDSYAHGYIDEATRRGVFQVVDPLEPARTAPTVRTRDGKVTTMEGLISWRSKGERVRGLEN